MSEATGNVINSQIQIINSRNHILIKSFSMADQSSFLSAVKTGYTFKTESVKIGIGMLDGKPVTGADINLPLKTMNRHGLDRRCHRNR